jgi:aspartyl-tRNA(Asn)/glutamyl-tRNA(Gln) amidotransferase subunit A
VAAAFEAALPVVAEFAELTDFEPPDLPWEEIANVVLMAEAASAFEEFIVSGEASQLTAPEDRTGLLHALALPAVDYLRAMRLRRAGMRQMDALLAGVDAVIAPAQPIVAPPLHRTFAEAFPKERGSLGAIGNLCGLPSITVPCGFGDRGLPVGLEFLGRAWDEGKIAALALHYQTRTSWHRTHPRM